MQNQIAFIESLQDSEESFVRAIIAEEQDDFEIEDTLERRYEEGFIDGMRHAWALLAGSTDEIGGLTSDQIEKITRDGLKAGYDRFDIMATLRLA